AAFSASRLNTNLTGWIGTAWTKNEKHQAPSTKLQRNTKSQAPNGSPAHQDLSELGAWSFSGAWMLVLGAFPNYCSRPISRVVECDHPSHFGRHTPIRPAPDPGRQNRRHRPQHLRPQRPGH